MFISSAFAQTAPAAGGDMQSTLLSMLPLALMFVVLYFVMIRARGAQGGGYQCRGGDAGR